MDQRIPASPYLTVDEVAAFLRQDASTIRRWCKDGKLQSERIGRSWLIVKASVPGL